MRKVKTIFVMMLTIIMMLAMGNVAMAATITVNNAAEGQTYTAYKVFDVTKKDDHYAYTASQDIYDLLYKDGATQVEGVTLTRNDMGTYNVEMTNTAETAKALADYLRTNKAELKSGIAKEAESTTVIFEGLSAGYYFVDSSVGALCILNTAADDMVVIEKNQIPNIHKNIGTDKTEASYDIGSVIPFTLTITAGGEADTTYIVHDTMTAGLTLDNTSFVIKVGAPDAAADAYTVVSDDKYTIRTTGLTDGCTFEIEFNQDYTGSLVKATKIVITYNATLNENASIGAIPETNKTKLQYGASTTEYQTVSVYTSKIIIDKVAENATGEKLAGAKFVLINAEGKYYKWNNTDKKVEWVDAYKTADAEVEGCVYTTDDTGAAEFKGIAAGEYSIKEIEAPAGYNVLLNSISVTIASTGDTAYANHTEQVINKTGVKLPETGGIGTFLFIVIGALAVLGAGLFLVTNKRMSKENM